MNMLLTVFLFSIAFFPYLIQNQQVNLTALGITQSQGIQYYSGYLQLANNTKVPTRNLHYLFITSQNGANLPLTIFLANNLNPGTSVLIDAFYNSGPFLIQNPSTGQQPQTLQFNSESLVFQSNLLYIDVISGVGYSYPELIYSDDNQVVGDSYQAIKQWLAINQYSQYGNHEIYLMGNGYGGIIIPKIAQQLLIANNTPTFQGILIGNPTFAYDKLIDYNQSFQNMFKFLSNHNFIDEQSMSAFPICTESGMEENFPLGQYFLQKFNQNFGKGINLWDVYGTNCFNDNLIPSMYTCLPLAPLASLLTANSTVNALFVQPPSKGWESFFNQMIYKSYQSAYLQNQTTTIETLSYLIGKIKVWIYDADSSAFNSIVNTRYYLSQMKLGNVVQAQYPYPFIQSTLLDMQVAGYITKYKGFVYATVKKGNYWAGQEQPKQYSALFSQFLS